MTPDEIEAIRRAMRSAALEVAFGPRWAICRPTKRNREKYGNCITRKQYQEISDRFPIAGPVPPQPKEKG